MSGRASPSDNEPGFSLPAFERAAPPPPPALVASRIDLYSSAGDVVADLFGRGGWVARAAVDRQRRAISLESSPLTRVLADVVLRPPDVRHLDAAFQGDGGVAPPGVEPQGLPRRPVRHALRDVLADARHRRDLVGRRPDRGARFRSGRAATGRPALPLHGLPRPAGRQRAAPGAARRGGPRPAPRRCRPRGGPRGPAQPVPGRPRGRGPGRRAARPAYAAPAGGPGGDHRPDRERPAGRARARGAAARLPALDPPGEPPDARAGADGAAADRRRPREAARGRRVARAQPVARLRGCGPSRARVRPAARGRRPRPAAGAPRRGPAQPGGGDRHRGPGAVEPLGVAAAPGRARARGSRPAGAAAPARARPAPGPPEHGAAVGRLSRDLVGPRARGRGPAADRRAERDLAAAAVELAGGDHRALPRGDDPGHGP